MNKIPVYLCIAILLGQVMLFSGEQNAFDGRSDSEFDSEKPFMTEGRYDPEEAIWQIETIDQSSSSSAASDVYKRQGRQESCSYNYANRLRYILITWQKKAF